MYEAALLTELTRYREELILSLSTARNAAAKHILKAQKRNKDYHDQRTTHTSYKVGIQSSMKCELLEEQLTPHTKYIREDLEAGAI